MKKLFSSLRQRVYELTYDYLLPTKLHHELQMAADCMGELVEENRELRTRLVELEKAIDWLTEREMVGR